VDVNPLGPFQIHEPPLTGWGPRFTVLPGATFILLVASQAPLSTSMYGVIGVEATVSVNVWVLVTPSGLV
jgi:hypothetical protein